MQDTSTAPAADTAARTPRRALLLVNPRSRRGAEALDGRVLATLADGGLDLTVEQTPHREDVPDLIRERVDAIDCVIVAGGDGSLNAAAPALVGTKLALGLLPMGTANDLARTLGIPLDPVAAAKVIAAGVTRAIDIGDVNGHYFFNVASVGLSAELARRLSPDVKRRWGRLGYALTALRVMLTARRFAAIIGTRSGEMRVRTLQIAVGNGRHYGGGMTVEATAEIDDKHLDLYSLELRSIWKLALMAPDLRRGSHGAWEEVRTARCTAFDIRTRRPRPVNCDGELVTFTPARVRLHPDAVTVFVPETARE